MFSALSGFTALLEHLAQLLEATRGLRDSGDAASLALSAAAGNGAGRDR
jgi:hypothetical protein